MKQFKNLREAFEHRTKCPFCDSKMSVGFERVETAYDSDKCVEKITLITGSIQFVIDSDDNIVMECRSGGAQFSGLFMFSVPAVCAECSKYAFVIGLSIDLLQMRVIEIFLNSETFSIERASTLHEIRNVYTMDKTEYSIFTSKLENKVELPLIPFDRNNPEKILDRIKGLLVFL